MSLTLLVNLLQVVNVIVMIALIIMVSWQGLINKNRLIYPLILFFILFCAALSSIIYTNKIEVVIITFAELTIVFLTIKYFTLLTHNKNSLLKNETQLISQAQEQERSRIYANLHDDVGAKLLELIYASKDLETKELAKDVLSNIRQAVAQTENIHCTIKQLIDTLVNESQSRLKMAGINLENSIKTLDASQKLAITVPNVILRISREVVSNIIKHAQADLVKLSVNTTQSGFFVEIVDNGVGFENNTAQGKGIKTINKRAQSINALVEWLPGKNNGTVFSLTYQYGNK